MLNRNPLSVSASHSAGPARAAPALLRAARLLLFAGVASASVAGLLALAGFASFHDAIARTEPRMLGRADGIVVLTGGAQRVNDALALLQQGHGGKLLISGVHHKTGRDELARHAPAARELLECCVDLGKGARNTIGNAIETRRWAEENRFRSLIVVTSNYHMPRTLREFRHALPGVQVTGYPVVTELAGPDRFWSDATTFRLIAAEYAKYVVTRLRHLVERDPETSRWPVLVGRQKPVGPQSIEKASEPAS